MAKKIAFISLFGLILGSVLVNAAADRVELKAKGLMVKPMSLKPGEQILEPSPAPGPKSPADTIYYDDGTPTTYFTNTNSYWAVRFTPGTMCTVKAGLTMTYLTGTACSLFVWDEAGGQPGSVLDGPIVFSPASQVWVRNDMTTTITTSGDFFIGFWSAGPPHSLVDAAGGDRSWADIGGGWQNLAGYGDLMIRAIVEYAGVVRDIGVLRVDNSQKSFLPNPGNATIWGVIENSGDSVEVNFDVTCQVTFGGTPVYDDTITVATLSPGLTDSLVFSPNWQPTQDGEYIINVTSHLSGDTRSGNDTLEMEVHVVTYPCDLAYDDGVGENAWAWNTAGDGWAQRFDGGAYPVLLDSIKFHIWDASWPTPGGNQMIAQVLEDDGAGGSPGTLIYDSGTITINRGAWNAIDVSGLGIQFNDGSFYVAYIQVGDYPNCPGLSEDQTPPISGQSWSYSGGAWSIDGSEYMIRARIAGPAVHDVGTASVDEPPDTVACNDSVSVAATVCNYGDTVETFDVEAIIDSSGIVVYADTQRVTDLDSLVCDTVNFVPWNVPPVHDVLYTVTVTTLLSTDVNAANDEATKGSLAWCPPAVHDVGTASVDGPPDTVACNDSVSVIATVCNYGDSVETFSVEAIIDSSGIVVYADTETVTNLNPPDCDTVNFAPWNVPPAHGVSYTATVTTMLATDINPTNNTATKGTLAWCPPGVEEELLSYQLPVTSYQLCQNSPNPFCHTTTIRYQVPGSRPDAERGRHGDLSTYQPINLSVYDLRGRLVRTLVDGVAEPGYKEVVWDGRDEFGRPVAGGIYFYTVQASHFRVTRKLVLIR